MSDKAARILAALKAICVAENVRITAFPHNDGSASISVFDGVEEILNVDDVNFD